ncbi:hypothetical protein, partial [Neisseria meningitidis]|uniref:hypothetical protein n=1 Tax=Neisseria meningitidis TaxID=487 RepID=UPI0021F1C0E1
ASVFAPAVSLRSGLGLGWVGLGWVGLGWVGLGWVGLGLVGLGWVGSILKLLALICQYQLSVLQYFFTLSGVFWDTGDAV